MEILGDLSTVGPVFLLFVTSGLIIYAVSSWMGEALIGQIKDNRTSVFGRSEDYAKAKSRTIYAPPSQLSTYEKTSTNTTPPGDLLPAIPSRLPVNRYHQ